MRTRNACHRHYLSAACPPVLALGLLAGGIQPVLANPTINPNATATQIEQSLSGPGITIVPGSLTVDAGTGPQYGTFTGGTGAATPGVEIDIDDGIFLSTGLGSSIPGPNDEEGVSDSIGTSFSDPELVTIDPNATNDPVVLRVRATPSASFLKVNFVFASDEYPEFVCSQFNDAFGFFIKPTTSNTWQNFALLPGSSTPIAVNTVNNGTEGAQADETACDLTNGALHVENGTGATPTSNTNLQFDGLTVPLTADIPVTPGTTYDVKLAIADSVDTVYDSAVFIKWVASSDFAEDVDLELDLAASATSVSAGTDVTFTVTVQNTGQDAAAGTVVSFPIPDDFNYVSDDAGGAYDPAAGLWTVPTTLAARTGSATLSVTASAGLAQVSVDAFAEVQSVQANDLDSTPGNGAQSPAEDDEDTVALSISGATPFVCNNTLYQVATNNSQLRRITITGTSSSFVDVGPGAGQQVNAGWGYYDQDELILGVRSGTTNLWMIDGNGNFFDLGTVAGMGTRRGSNAGDILPDGRMIFKTATGQLTVIDLTVTPYAVSDTITLTGPAAGANYIDFAYNPIDGRIYSIDSGPDRLFWIDPDTGATGYFGPAVFDGAYGAQWVDEDGRFYAYNNNTNEMFVINIGTNGNGSGTPTLIAVSTNDEGGINDGAFCRGPAPVPLGAITGTVFGDLDSSGTQDSGEPGLGPGLAVQLFDQRGTPSNTSDDVLVATVETAADGSYAFTDVLAGQTYRIEVDVTDPDLPGGAAASTPNPITDVSVLDGQTVADQDFGFNILADLSISKVVDVPSPATGDTVTFTLTVANASQVAPQNVAVSDQLPAGLTFLSATGDGSYDAGSGVWTIGTVAGNGTAQLQIEARVDATGDVTNRAEIISSSLGDPDSDVQASFEIDDLADGLADDDEAEVTLSRTDRFVSGTVFEDNGASGATAHDGQRGGGEAGRGGVVVRAIDVANGTVYATTTTDGDGAYRLVLPDAAVGRSVQIEAAATAPFRAISEQPGALPGLVNPDTTDGLVVFTPTAGVASIGVDFGQVREPTLIQDQTVTTLPGTAVLLAHTYQSHTAGSVTFDVANATPNPTNAFSAPTIFHDADCSGAIDNAEAIVPTPLAVTAGQTVCLLVRVQPSSGAPGGSELVYDLTAQSVFDTTAVSVALANTDKIRLVSSRSLSLVKQVRNVSDGGAFGVSNRADPGETLEYRVVFANQGNEAISNINVFDKTPAFTTLADTLAPVTVVPAGMACSIVEPAGGGSGGYIGNLRWTCTGVMSPGDTGEVRFSVQVDP